MDQRFDVVIIGSGTAGSTVASTCRSAGWSVAVVDSLPFGGTCALRGCDPKKVLVGAAELLDFSQRLSVTQSVKGTLEIDWPKLIKFKRSFTDPVPKQKEQSFHKAAIKSFHGRARFVDARSIEVAGQRLDARFIVIASGAKPATLHIPGEEHLITSTQFLELQQLPSKIVFVGGGYIAMEFAHVTARAGARPSVLHRGERVLEGFDPDLVSKLATHSQELGIVLHTQTTVDAIEKSADGFVVLVSQHGEKNSFLCDLAVHAAGRVPDIDDLGLEKGNVEREKNGGVKVNGFLQSVSNHAVYAGGDSAATDGLPLTPVAGYDGKVISSNLIKGNRLKAEYEAIPTVVFTVPALASVGLSEDAAKRKGAHFRKNYLDIGSWYSSRRVGERTAAVKVLIDEDSDRILGAHLLGPAAEETINLFVLAMRAYDCERIETSIVCIPHLCVGRAVHGLGRGKNLMDCCGVDSKNARDLTASRAAWLLWYAPIAVIIAGSFWTVGRNWLWAGAFTVMGIGCVVNASRCQRLHCYFTGPLFLAAAGYAIAAQFRLVSLRSGLFLLIVLGLACTFQCAEKPFGRYRKGV